MLHTGSNEEIETCSMHSEDISNDDIESLEELSHKVDIKGHKQQNNEENGKDDDDKHEEQDGEESRKDDTEKEDVFDESLENAYGMEGVQKATSSSYCKKCEVNFKKHEKFSRHLIEGHKTNACRSCDDIFHTRTESEVHVHKTSCKR